MIELEQKIKNYLASGGKITIVPEGVSGQPLTTTQKHAKEKKKGRGRGITINPSKR